MILRARNISVDLGQRRVVDDVSLTLKPGQMIGVIGPNGTGKTTLLRVLAGLRQPGHGTIHLNGVEMGALSHTARAQILAYLPQDHVIAWPIAVDELVAMGRSPYRRRFAGPSAVDKQAVADALKAMSITHLAKRSSCSLSGGERARVLLARALAQTPRTLLADEPTAGLDPAHKLRLLQHLSATARQGMSVVVVLHDLSMAARFCDHLILLHQGKIYRQGPPGLVLTRKTLRNVYDIDAHIGEVQGVPVIAPLSVEDQMP